MPRIDDYKNALELAREQFRQQDPGRLAAGSGIEVEKGEAGLRLILPFLNRKVRISWPEGEILGPDPSKELSLQEQVLILHYLLKATGSPVRNKWITFREIPSGEFYYSAFVKRAKEPLVKAFGRRPELLIELGLRMGGLPAKEGEFSVCFQALPRVPVCLILWAGDEEFPPDGNLLFDESISQYLSAEDIAVLSGMVVYPLVGMAYEKP